MRELRSTPAHARYSPQKKALWQALAGAVCALTLLTPLAFAQMTESPVQSSADRSLTPGSRTPRTQPDGSAPEPFPYPSMDRSVRFSVVAAGDVLPHGPVNESARTSNGFDFTPLMENVQPLLTHAGLALCHMEVPIAAVGAPPKSYPIFAAPRPLVASLKRAGWDGCSTASNHSDDMGANGILVTLDEFDAQGLGHVGTARNAQNATPQIYEVSAHGMSVQVAHISVTKLMNAGAGGPRHVEAWEVDRSSAAQVIETAKKARKAGADIVLVSIHDGTEYEATPTAQQVQYAQELADSGEIDATIGHHAHVPQPITQLKGGVDGNGMWAAYGLGNFLSNQDVECCVAATSNGLMYFIDVEASPTSPARVTGVSWRATTVDRKEGHAVLDLSQLAHEKRGSGSLSATEIARRYAEVKGVVGNEAPELADIEPSKVEVEVIKRG